MERIKDSGRWLSQTGPLERTLCHRAENVDAGRILFGGIPRRCCGDRRCSYHRRGRYQAQQDDASSQQLNGIARVKVSPQQDGNSFLTNKKIPSVIPVRVEDEVVESKPVVKYVPRSCKLSQVKCFDKKLIRFAMQCQKVSTDYDHGDYKIIKIVRNNKFSFCL